jgi:hypothetical protein
MRSVAPQAALAPCRITSDWPGSKHQPPPFFEANPFYLIPSRFPFFFGPSMTSSHFHPYTRRSMSNGEVEYRNRFFYLRVPPRVPSPPIPQDDPIVINTPGSGAPNNPIEIYDGSSDEAAPTDCIDPSLRHNSPDLGARIPTPGLSDHATNPVVRPAPPGLIPTQPAPVVEPDILVPALNEPGAPPAFAAPPAPRPFPAPVFPTPSHLPAIPPVSDLALQSYIRYATGQPQVEDSHLRAYKSPSPILVSDIPERREPPG